MSKREEIDDTAFNTVALYYDKDGKIATISDVCAGHDTLDEAIICFERGKPIMLSHMKHFNSLNDGYKVRYQVIKSVISSIEGECLE